MMRTRNILSILLAIAMVLAPISQAVAAIEIDTIGGMATWHDVTNTFDASGYDKLVVIATGEHGFNQTGNGSISGITYDGVPMIELINRTTIKPTGEILADDTWNAIYYLDNPATSAGVITANWSSRGSVTVFGLMGTAEGAGNTVISDRDTSSADLLTSNGSIVIASYGLGGAGNTAQLGNVTTDAPLTEISRLSNGGWDGHVTAYANDVAAGNATYSFTDTSGGRLGGNVILAEFLNGITETLIWDGHVGVWSDITTDAPGDSHWEGGALDAIPSIVDPNYTASFIHTGSATVTSPAQGSYTLDVAPDLGDTGTLSIVGGDLTVPMAMTSTTELTISDGGKLTTGNGTIAAVTIGTLAGSTGTINTGNSGSITATDLTILDNSTLAVQGSGTLSFSGASTVSTTGTSINVSEGANLQLAHAPTGVNTLDLDGGTIKITGEGTVSFGTRSFDFESGDLTGWNVVDNPHGPDNLFTVAGNAPVSHSRIGPKQGTYWIDGYQTGVSGNSDGHTGILETDAFILGANAQITMLVGGGDVAWSGDPDAPVADLAGIGLERLVGGDDWESIHWETGGGNNLTARAFDASAYEGDTVRIRYYDTKTGGWGWAAVDDIQISSASGVPVLGAIDLSSVVVNVTADSTLDMRTDSTATFGSLNFNGQGILTLAGAVGGVNFADTTVSIAPTGDIGFNTAANTSPGAINIGAGIAATIVKTGAADLILTIADPTIGIGGSLGFDVREGRLIAQAGSNPLGVGSAVGINGGEVVLIAPDAATNPTFVNPITSTGGALTAGRDGDGFARTVTVQSDVTLDSGDLLMQTKDGYTLNIADNIIGAGGMTVGAGSNVVVQGTINAGLVTIDGNLETKDAVTVSGLVANEGGVYSATGTTKDLTVTQTLTLNSGIDLSAANVVLDGADVTVKGLLVVNNNLGVATPVASVDVSNGGGLTLNGNSLKTAKLATTGGTFDMGETGSFVATGNVTISPAGGPDRLELTGGTMSISGGNGGTAGMTYIPITGDLDDPGTGTGGSQISSDKTYTHAIDFGNSEAATVNGVVFAKDFSGNGSESIPNRHNGDLNTDVTGDIARVFHDFDYNDPTAEIILTGLTEGTWYDFRLYNRAFGEGGDRFQDFLYDVGNDGSTEETVTLNADDPTIAPVGLDVWNRGYAMSYTYQATASGELKININSAIAGNSYHIYGLTNEEMVISGGMNRPDTDLLMSAATTLDIAADVTLGDLSVNNAAAAELNFTGDIENRLVLTSTTFNNLLTGLTVNTTSKVNLGELDLAEAAGPAMTKLGTGEWIIAESVAGDDANYTGAATFNVNEGTLVLGDTGLLGAGATVNVANGAALKLSSMTPAKTYNEPITLTSGATILAGMADSNAAETAVVTLPTLPSAGKSVTLGTTDEGYTLEVAGAVAADSLSLGGVGTVKLTSGGSVNSTIIGSTGTINVPTALTVANKITLGDLDITDNVAMQIVGANLADPNGTITVSGSAFTMGTAAVEPVLPVTAGLLTQWDASAITGVADGAQVDTWANAANGGTYDLTRMAGSPKYDEVVAGLNDRSAVVFSDGGGDWFEFDDINTIRSVFWVLRDTAPTKKEQFLLGDDGAYHFHSGTGDQLFNGQHASANIKDGRIELNGVDIGDGTTTARPTDFGILSVVTTGNVEASRLSHDRNQNDNGARTWQGEIAEVLIYDTALSEADEDLVGAYLASKYNLTTSYDAVLPAGPIDMPNLNLDLNTGVSTIAINGRTVTLGDLTLGDNTDLTITGTETTSFNNVTVDADPSTLGGSVLSTTIRGKLQTAGGNTLTSTLAISGDLTMAAGSSTSIAGGTLTTGNLTHAGGNNTIATGSTVNVTNLNVTGGTLNATAPVTVSGEATIGEHVIATTDTVNTFGVTGSDVLTERTLTLNGGTMELTGEFIGSGAGDPVDMRPFAANGASGGNSDFVKASSSYTPDGRYAYRTADASGQTYSEFPTGTTSTGVQQTMWLTNGTTGPGNWIAWDLGAEYTIAKIHVWNYNEANHTGRGVQSFDLQTDGSIDFGGAESWATELAGVDWNAIGANGTIVVPADGGIEGSNQASYTGFEWTLPSTITTRYIRFNDTQNFGTKDAYTGLSEVVFLLSSVASTEMNLAGTTIATTADSTVHIPDTNILTLGGVAPGAGTKLTIDSSAATINMTNMTLGGGSQVMASYATDATDPDAQATFTVTGTLTGGASVSELGDFEDVGKVGLTMTADSTYNFTLGGVDSYVEATGAITLEDGMTINITGTASATPQDVKLLYTYSDLYDIAGNAWNDMDGFPDLTGVATTDPEATSGIYISLPAGWGAGELGWLADQGPEEDQTYLILLDVTGTGIGSIDGDADDDQDVDEADMAVLLAQFGSPHSTTRAIDDNADFNGDGYVDMADFVILRANWGEGTPAPGATDLPDTTPEPATMSLLAIGALVALRRRRRK